MDKTIDNKIIFDLLEKINNKYLNKIFNKLKINIDIQNKEKQKKINIHTTITNYIKNANTFFKSDRTINDENYIDKLNQINKYFKEASPNEKYGRDLDFINKHLSILIMIIYNFNLYDITDASEDSTASENELSNDENSNLLNLIISIYTLCMSCIDKNINYENELKFIYDIDNFNDDSSSCDEKSCNIQKKYLKYKHKYIKSKKLLKNR
jgi:hypothetical protein